MLNFRHTLPEAVGRIVITLPFVDFRKPRAYTFPDPVFISDLMLFLQIALKSEFSEKRCRLVYLGLEYSTELRLS